MAVKKRNTSTRTAGKTPENAQSGAARESSVEALQRGMRNLADVRDLLSGTDLGADHCLAPEAVATFARATLALAGAEMERALFDLGLFERKQCCQFLPYLPEQPAARGG